MKKKLLTLNFKIFDQKNLGSIPRILLSSLIVILSFYSIPKLIELKNDYSNEFKNNSKAILAYTLKNEDGSLEDEKILNENDLLIDILYIRKCKFTL